MSPENDKHKAKSESYLVSLIIIGLLFFVFGFVTWLNGPLINILQHVCSTTPFKASLVTLAFYIAYFFMALPSSYILKRTGYKNGMSIGLIIMALGALVFIPAAYSRTFGMFLTGLFVLGTGLALLQTAVNPFVTIVGPIESAASRISFMGIANKLAGVISPLVLTSLVMQGLDIKLSPANFDLLDAVQQNALLDEFAGRMVVPYLILAAFLFIFAGLIKLSSLPENIESDDHTDDSLGAFIRQIPSALKIRRVLLGFIAIFVYVGVEVMAGDSLTQFGRSLNLSFASQLTSYTMAFMVIGYIIGIILIPKYVRQATALTASAVLGILFSVGAIISSSESTALFNATFGWLNSLFHAGIPALPDSVFFVSLLGLANALMWPAIWPLTLNHLGKYTKIASALLIMGIAGGALIPPFYAKLGMTIGFQDALYIMIPIYIYIVFFAVKGHKLRSK